VTAYERRIGQRVDVDPVEVLWRVPSERHRRRWRRGGGVQTGALVDLSVSGLKVRAPAADDLSVGAVVPVEIDGVAGDVAVRRIVPVPGTRFADYGVQLTPASHDLARWCTARLDRHSEVGEADWLAALDNRTR
jgi:hypothetical protein